MNELKLAKTVFCEKNDAKRPHVCKKETKHEIAQISTNYYQYASD